MKTQRGSLFQAWWKLEGKELLIRGVEIKKRSADSLRRENEEQVSAVIMWCSVGRSYFETIKTS